MITDMALYYNEATPTYNSAYCNSYRSGSAVGGIIGGLFAVGCCMAVIYFCCIKGLFLKLLNGESLDNKAPEPEP